MGSIAKIHDMLVTKQVSCAELTKSYLDEIEKSNGELNAYVNVTPDEALKTVLAVPRVFLPLVLKGCVDWAKENGVELVTEEHMKIIQDKRAREKQAKKK